MYGFIGNDGVDWVDLFGLARYYFLTVSKEDLENCPKAFEDGKWKNLGSDEKFMEELFNMLGVKGDASESVGVALEQVMEVDGRKYSIDVYNAKGKNWWILPVQAKCCDELKFVGYQVWDDKNELIYDLRMDSLFRGEGGEVIRRTISVAAGLAGGGLATPSSGTAATITHVWTGARILGSRGGSVDANVVASIIRAMENGSYRFISTEGRIGGFIDENGAFIITEGHHRMQAAMEIFRRTGNSKFVDELLKNGRWTSGGTPPSGSPLPSIK